MDVFQLNEKGCYNTRTKFHMKNGETLIGVVITSPIEGSNDYVFLPANKMKEYSELQEAKELIATRSLLQPINLDDIQDCEKF